MSGVKSDFDNSLKLLLSALIISPKLIWLMVWSALWIFDTIGEINSAMKLFIRISWDPKMKIKSSSSWYLFNTMFFNPDDEMITDIFKKFKIKPFILSLSLHIKF